MTKEKWGARAQKRMFLMHVDGASDSSSLLILCGQLARKERERGCARARARVCVCVCVSDIKAGVTSHTGRRRLKS